MEKAEVIQKRLRTLNKRLLKIEKYEETPESLNPDQLEACEKKPIVLALILELTEIAKQQQAFANQQQVLFDQEKQSLIDSYELKFLDLQNQAKQNTHNCLGNMLSLIHILSNSNLACTNLRDDQFNALQAFKMIMNSSDTSLAVSCFEKYTESSPDLFHEHVSYSNLNDFVQVLINPPPPPQFQLQDSQITLTSSEHLQTITSSTPNISTITFIHPSELVKESAPIYELNESVLIDRVTNIQIHEPTPQTKHLNIEIVRDSKLNNENPIGSKKNHYYQRSRKPKASTNDDEQNSENVKAPLKSEGEHNENSKSDEAKPFKRNFYNRKKKVNVEVNPSANKTPLVVNY